MNDVLTKATVHLKRHVDLAISLLALLRFNKEHLQQFTAVCLHTRTIHLAAGCQVTAKALATPCLPMLIRAMWEADIDLDNVISDPHFPKRMYASFLKEKLRLSDAAHPGKTNRFLAHIPGAMNLQQVILATTTELDKLKADGYGPLSIRSRADKAKRLDEYDSIYNLMSLDAHNNIRSLEVDHVERHTDGSYSLTLYSSRMTIEAIKDVLIATGILAASIDKTHKLLGTVDQRSSGVLDSWCKDREGIEQSVITHEQNQRGEQALSPLRESRGGLRAGEA